MLLDELPDLILHQICLKLEAKDIQSLQKTNQRLFHYTRANRLHYKKYELESLKISLTKNGERQIEIERRRRGIIRWILEKSLDDVMNSVNPKNLISYDHDELMNMSPLWWRERTEIELHDIFAYRRYSQYLDRCTSITLTINYPMNLSEILEPMETKNLEQFRVLGYGKIECRPDDFMKIGRLSRKMKSLKLANMNASSNIPNDVILDMIEIGSFADNAHIDLSQMQENMLECLGRREWVFEWKKHGKLGVKVTKIDGLTFWIRKSDSNRGMEVH